ncbi:MAG: carbon monoxide dehydrogenase, partial [Roseomonas mucosa]|nr:carbon monoxide dehydrogenase [Roseomonas mucosa]
GVPEPEEVAASAAATPVESPVPKAADSAVSGLALVRAMMPREFLGQSMIFWGGLVVWLLMMALIFLG